MPLTLSARITDHFRITQVQKDALKRLGIETVENLLYHFPVRYGDTAEAKSVDSLQQSDTAVIFGKINGLRASKGFKSKMTMATGYVEDETGRLQCVWFNQPYVAKMYTDGMLVRVEGKVSERRKKKELYLSNPKIEVVETVPIGVGDSLFGDGNESHTLYPVYPESRGITSSWIYHTLQKIFKAGILDTIEDPIPVSILENIISPACVRL